MLKAIMFTVLSLSPLVPLEASAVSLPLTSSPAPNAGIELVYGGCGPYSHRGPYGGCQPGGQYGGYIPWRGCPPGWHVGPYGRHCWPNR